MKDARKIDIGEEPKGREEAVRYFFFLKIPGADAPWKKMPLVKEKKGRKKRHAHINDNWKCHFARRSHGG